MKEQKLDEFIVLLDNLKGQMQDDFKYAVGVSKGLLWYGVPGVTDLWEPFGAGYAATLKAFIAVEHRKWLDTDNDSDRWFGNERATNIHYAVGRGNVDSLVLSRI